VPSAVLGTTLNDNTEDTMKNERRKTIIDMLVVTALATLPVACATEASDDKASPGTQDDVSAIRLTAEQQEALQADVTGHLNDYGEGTQIGINQISFDDGNTILTLPLPGETRARAVDEPISQGLASACHSNQVGWACLWSDTNFNGTRIEHLKCETLTLTAPFNSSTASVYNNQTAGTQTIILNASGQILNASVAPTRINDLGVLNRNQARRWRVCP
jgi:hypothetical protein